jgi:hypothetical protein
MIDLISMNKTGLSDNEVSQITAKNHLQTNSKAGVMYYDNERMKFADGFYIRIETKKIKSIKLECSLHKYFNHLATGKQTNYDLFSFSNARNTIEQLTEHTEIDLLTLKVTYYEIGLNLILSKDCREYIDKMQTIGAMDNKRVLYVNPKYKNDRIKTTVFHRDIKKVYKVYDKVFEMHDKKRTDTPVDSPNILRIETTQKRVEKMTVFDLLKPETVTKLTDQFLKDWRTVQFEQIMEAPKGTHQRKVDLIREILKHGTETVLKMAKERLSTGDLTEKRHRAIREFIQNDWNDFKKLIKFTKTPEEIEFREALNKTLKTTRY